MIETRAGRVRLTKIVEFNLLDHTPGEISAVWLLPRAITYIEDCGVYSRIDLGDHRPAWSFYAVESASDILEAIETLDMKRKDAP